MRTDGAPGPPLRAMARTLFVPTGHTNRANPSAGERGPGGFKPPLFASGVRKWGLREPGGGGGVTNTPWQFWLSREPRGGALTMEQFSDHLAIAFRQVGDAALGREDVFFGKK